MNVNNPNVGSVSVDLILMEEGPLNNIKVKEVESRVNQTMSENPPKNKSKIFNTRNLIIVGVIVAVALAILSGVAGGALLAGTSVFLIAGASIPTLSLTIGAGSAAFVIGIATILGTFFKNKSKNKEQSQKIVNLLKELEAEKAQAEKSKGELEAEKVKVKEIERELEKVKKILEELGVKLEFNKPSNFKEVAHKVQLNNAINDLGKNKDMVSVTKSAVAKDRVEEDKLNKAKQLAEKSWSLVKVLGDNYGSIAAFAELSSKVLQVILIINNSLSAIKK